MYGGLRVRISISGAQCTGKSTLIDALEKRLPEYAIQRESVRYLVKKYGFEIEAANTDLQLALLNLQTRSLYEHKDILLDRSFVDSTAYMLYYHKRKQPEVPAGVYNYIMDAVKELAQNIDLFVFLKPEFELVDDGFRVLDNDQQQEITELMGELFDEFDIRHKVLEVSGSVEDRVDQILFYINNI
jgi:nicotinamide riboside kinase